MPAAENTKQSVLIVHGCTSNRTEGMRYAKAIINAGFNLLAKDPRIKAGVFSGSYANSMEVLADQIKPIFGLPHYLLIPMVSQLFAWRGNLDIHEINPEKYIAQISPRPVYIMHGTADKTVEFKHGLRLFEAANEPKQFWRAENGEHTELWQLDNEKAESSVVTFFNRYLK